MRYMVLIYGDESQMLAPGSPGFDEMMAGYGAFTQHIIERGAMVSGDPLHPSSTATTVRVRNGETLTTDGPYAETKEQLGGYYILDCKDLDDAISLAAMIPGAHSGSVEVRPVADMG
jgi:hypothetical protein